MSEPLETIMESREEFMVSPIGDSKPTLRIAYFLKPSVTSIDGPTFEIHSSSTALSPTFEPKKWPLTVNFSGWPYPPRKWIQWVDSLHSTYESMWRKVGIYEAIMNTKYYLLKNEDLVFGIAERWCSETNTFLFPWAEATITLEDIMFLGGYPVLGDSVFRPLETQELKKIEEKLILARMETCRTKSQKACIHSWMGIFVNSEREIEHEAFLVAWLSIFVFPDKSFLVKKIAFPIAIHLARGTAIALAPAVLASIYRDLSSLKKTMVNLTRNLVDGGDKELLQLRSPFYLVQIWVWERIEVLKPKPKLTNPGDPIMSRWHRVKALEIDSVRSVLDSAMDDFVWRPYARFAGNRLFYAENSVCIPIDHNLDNEIVCFVICMRVSELVGLDCIEQYLPHRVAMQFGMDQDIPGSVARSNKTPQPAWNNYLRPITDSKVFIPSRFFEADVTTRYAKWWKKSILGQPDPVKNPVQGKRSPRSWKKRSNDDAAIPPGFPPKCRKSFSSGNYSGFLLEGSQGCRIKINSSENLPYASLEQGSHNHTSSGKVESDQIGVFPSPFAANKTDVSIADGVEILVKKEDADEIEGLNCDAEQETEEKSSFASTGDHGTLGQMDLQMKPPTEIKTETSMAAIEEAQENTNGSQVSKQSGLAYDRVSQSWTEEDNNDSYIFEIYIVDIENRISRLEKVLLK